MIPERHCDWVNEGEYDSADEWSNVAEPSLESLSKETCSWVDPYLHSRVLLFPLETRADEEEAVAATSVAAQEERDRKLEFARLLTQWEEESSEEFLEHWRQFEDEILRPVRSGK